MNTEDVDGEPPRKKRRGGELGRDWKCEFDGCTKDFKSAGQVSLYGAHVKPFFLQKKALTTHTNITHLGQRDHVCPHETCKRAFGYKHLLQRHLAKRHSASSASESSDEDAAFFPTPAAAKLDIDTITGNNYAQAASKKLKAAKALRCPYPHLDDLAAVADGLLCDYVFSRAYDLRRHLQSEHDVIVDKNSVDMWVQVRWREQK
ncbi:hypothetical protein DFH08DRAFT_108248 [Mycena albidolilacea]|uniref:C2H2-type domain-containing protein n=1 Tax=Mycena albidolilacea TaxID=1033008 RepID=A0AAD7A684_9AGAR|nr:hypothetical protein DFH08DRAFT_108248 [Mycena albidolilacea]